MLFDPFQKTRQDKGITPRGSTDLFLCVKRWDCCGGEAEWISFTLDPCRWMNRKGRQTHPMPNETLKETSSARREPNTFKLPKNRCLKIIFQKWSAKRLFHSSQLRQFRFSVRVVAAKKNCQVRSTETIKGDSVAKFKDSHVNCFWGKLLVKSRGVFDVTCKKSLFWSMNVE